MPATFDIGTAPPFLGFYTPIQDVLLVGQALIVQFVGFNGSFATKACLSEDAACAQCTGLSLSSPLLRDFWEGVPCPAACARSRGHPRDKRRRPTDAFS